MEFQIEKKRLFKSAIFVLIILGVFLIVQVVAGLKTLGTIGEGVVSQNTISVSGVGNVYAKPDIATFSMSVDQTGATVALAQTKVDTVVSKILAYLKDQGVADKD